MTKTYKVVGLHAVCGTPPGETFDADLTDFEEATLTTAGHIEEVVAHRRKVSDFTEEEN